MLIEEINKSNAPTLKNRDLYSLRLRALQVWDKSFSKASEIKKSDLSRGEFLKKYGIIVEEMRKREIYKNTYDIDRVYFFQKMHGIDVPSLPIIKISKNSISLGVNSSKGGFLKGEECNIIVEEIEQNKIKEEVKKALSSYFEAEKQYNFLSEISKNDIESIEKSIPLYDIMLVPREKTEISKPEVTENYVRLPVDKKDHSKHKVRTIDFKSNIKALWCVDCKKIITLLFDKEKYTMAEAKKWLSEHEVNKVDEVLKCFYEEEIVKSKKKSIEVIKVDSKEQIVAFVVYSPGEVDLQGDTATEEEIEKACHDFNLNKHRFRVNHDDIDVDVDLLESYILPITGQIGGQEVKKGSWIGIAKVNDKEVWQKIDGGELTGISMRGLADFEEIEV